MSNEPEKIVVNVMCLFVHAGRILVEERYDSSRGEGFYRLIGGGMEFFETAEEAIRREVREELDSGIEKLEFLTVLQNPKAAACYCL